jgi:hypothetical protein
MKPSPLLLPCFSFAQTLSKRGVIAEKERWRQYALIPYYIRPRWSKGVNAAREVLK